MALHGEDYEKYCMQYGAELREKASDTYKKCLNRQVDEFTEEDWLTIQQAVQFYISKI